MNRKTFVLAFLLLFACSKVGATDDFKIVVRSQSDWTHVSSVPGERYLQSAVADGAIYTVPAVNATVPMYPFSGYNVPDCYRFTSSGSYIVRLGYFSPVAGSGDYHYPGPAVSADSDGVLWVSATIGDNGVPWSAATKAVAYYTPAPTLGTSYGNLGKTRALSEPVSARCDYMSAYGHTTTGTGYLWFCPNSYAIIERYTVTSGAVGVKTKFNLPSEFTKNNATASRVVQYADNKVMYDHRSSTLYKGVINEVAGTIEWESLGVSNSGAGATVFVFKGHEILAYSSSPTVVTIKDVTANEVLAQITPFSQESSTLIKHDLHAVVNGEDANLYVYVPTVGAACYTIGADMLAPAVTDIKVEIETNEVEAPGRQDALLSWTAPVMTSTSVSSYDVYYMTKYVSAQNENIESGWNLLAEGVTDTKIVHNDVKWYRSGAYYAQRHYIYKIVPHFANGEIGIEAQSDAVAPEFIAISPIWTSVENYAGYCKTQLKWIAPDYGLQPYVFNVVRDSEVIKDGIDAVVFVDQSCKAGVKHSYKIQSVYSLTTGNVVAESTVQEVEVAKRDWAKPTYQISEIYNYRIGTAAGEVNPHAGYTNFTDRNTYRQGVYYNGYWYIAQRSDQTSYSETASGGIIKISAAEPSKNSTENVLTAGTRITLPTGGEIIHGQNVGIGVDDAGNFFVRDLSNDYSSGSNYRKQNNYMAMLHNGIIYSSDFSKAYTVDLSGIKFDEFGLLVDSNVPGRADYYSMKGNVLSAEGGYLYIAPTRTKSVYVVKLTFDGSKVVASQHSVYTVEGSNSLGVEFQHSNENYAFPVKCAERKGEQFIHNLRSNCYTNLSASTAQATTVDGDGVVYDTNSRVNNSGGCTLEFNGELFIITPHSQYSINTGSFYVGMGHRFDIDENGNAVSKGAAYANLTEIIPACDLWQDDDKSADYSNANGVWLYAELPDLAVEPEADITGDGEPDYAYIYMYVPGTRIAKYKLEPSSIFPPTQVDLEILPQYDVLPGSNQANTDLKQYDATLSWNDIEDYGTTVDENGNAYYAIEGYTVELIDENGNIVPIPDNIPEDLKVYENGVAVALKFEVDLYSEDGVNEDAVVFGNDGAIYYNGDIVPGLTYATYEKDGEIYHRYTFVYPDVAAIDEDGHQRDFTAYVQVNYIGSDPSNAGQAQSSAKTEYENSNGYEPVAPEGSVTVYQGPQLWADWNADGEKDINDGYWDSYRVEIDFDKPDAQEPVSYYEVTYVKPDGTTGTVIVDPSTIMGDNNSPFEGYEDGDGASTVPGTYNFDEKEKASDDSKTTSVISFNVTDYVGAVNPDESVYNEEHPNPEDGPSDVNNPANWTYTITAVYAGDNDKIKQSASTEITTVLTGTTLIDEISSSVRVTNVYPIPATAVVNVESNSPMSQIIVLSVAGNQIKSIDCDGATRVSVAVDDLTAGYYLLKVDNRRPVKIMVK